MMEGKKTEKLEAGSWKLKGERVLKNRIYASDKQINALEYYQLPATNYRLYQLK